MPNLSDITLTGSLGLINSNSKPQRLSNGWLIVAVVKPVSTTYSHYIYVYKPEQTTPSWQQLCYMNNATNVPGTFCVKGTNVYYMFAYGDTTLAAIYYLTFDATTVTNVDLFSSKVLIDDNFNMNGYCGISSTINDSEIHLAYSVYITNWTLIPNVRYVKGSIAPDKSITWGAVQRVTDIGSGGAAVYNPSIVYVNGYISIFVSYNNGSNVRSILNLTNKTTAASTAIPMGMGWGNSTVDSNGNYHVQEYPSAIFVPKSINSLANGRLWVAWDGLDTTDTVATNIRISFSDDNGLTWSVPQKLTSGNSLTQKEPSISANKSNQISVVWHGNSASSNNWYRIRKIKNTAGTWGTITDVTTNTTAHCNNPAVLHDLLTNYTEPLFIYRNEVSAKIGFYGTWSNTIISGNDEYIGQTVSGVTKTYSITDSDVTTRTVIEKINGVQTKSYTGTMGTSYTFSMTTFDTLSYGTHTLSIECNGEERVWTLKKIFGAHSDISSVITALQSAVGYNQKEILKTVMSARGVNVSASDSFDNLLTKLVSAPKLKRFATGTATSPSTGAISYTTTDGAGYNFAPFSVSGLLFTPKTVVIYNMNSGIPLVMYSNDGQSKYNGSNVCLVNTNQSTSNGTVYSLKEPATVPFIKANGFSLPPGVSGGLLNWIAFE